MNPMDVFVAVWFCKDIVPVDDLTIYKYTMQAKSSHSVFFFIFTSFYIWDTYLIQLTFQK